MKANFPTNHNYFYEKPLVSDADIKACFKNTTKQAQTIKNDFFENDFELTTKTNSFEQLKIFRFKEEKDVTEENEEQLILKLFKKNTAEKANYIVQTGLFAGVVYHKGCEFNIHCAYGDVFLHRMLNFLNGVYIDTESVTADKSKSANVFQHILTYLFVHSLERSATLGLPQVYLQKTQRSSKVRGSIDINAYLRHDIPFQGKLTTRFKEQTHVQEIVDLLYLASEKLKKLFGIASLQPIQGLYQQLKAEYSGKYITDNEIQRAKQHPALHNPMYFGFKETLTYAEIILTGWELSENKKCSAQTHGYLFDISQLFEVYLEKLLAQHLPMWSVSSQEQLSLYSSCFFKRNMFPDIVLKHHDTGKVIVLDAKFKKMRLEKHDLDRSDFYQIHTYMQYYGDDLLFGGLLYPLTKSQDINIAYSHSLFDVPTSKTFSPCFIVDGIQLDEVNSSPNNSKTDNQTNDIAEIDIIIQQEQKFIERMECLIDKATLNTPNLNIAEVTPI